MPLLPLLPLVPLLALLSLLALLPLSTALARLAAALGSTRRAGRPLLPCGALLARGTLGGKSVAFHLQNIFQALFQLIDE